MGFISSGKVPSIDLNFLSHVHLTCNISIQLLFVPCFIYLCTVAQKRTKDLTRRLQQAEDTMKMAAGVLRDDRRKYPDMTKPKVPLIKSFVKQHNDYMVTKGCICVT